MATNITEHCFEYGAMKYFRGNAHLVEIGTCGQKHDPPGAKAYLDPYSTVQREHLAGRVDKGKPVGLDWGRTTKAALEANGPVSVFGLNLKAAATFSYEKVKSADLKLYNLSITEKLLKDMLNRDAGSVRQYLADEGQDGRIVSEVWVVMDAELAEHFDTSGSVSAAANGLGLNITAKGGKHGTQTITLSKGAVFAYKLHKVKDWNKGKTRVENVEADYKGMG
jgi:hypothetical protein